MDAKLVGIHKVERKNPDGSVKQTYYYAWRGGPRLKSKPGTQAFVREFAKLTADRQEKAKDETLAKVVDAYVASADYTKLKPSTRRDYERIIGVIRVQFGDLPLEALHEKGARSLFLEWRDSMSASPRSADLHISVLGRILSWGKGRELIDRNPLERAGRLHKGGNRKDNIWTPSQLNLLLAEGSPQVVAVVKCALWTMQRQADILTMPTLAYSDGGLWIKQGKTGARVRITPADEIVPYLEEAKASGRQRVLANSYGEPWTSSGFRASLRTEMKRLKISGVTFHDLRGTGISYAYAHGVDIERVAEISGHSKTECESIIRKHYLGSGDVIEAIRAGTKSA